MTAAPTTPDVPAAEGQSPDNPFDRHAPIYPTNTAADNTPALEPGQPQPGVAPPVAPPAPAALLPPSAPQQAPPSLLDTAAAAFRQNNVLSSLYDRVTNNPDAKTPAVAGYDSSTDIAGYEDYAQRFVGSTSPAQTQVIKNRIDEENADKALIQRSGAAGYALAMAAGIVDPITLTMMLIPGAGEVAGASRFGKIAATIGTNVAFGEAQQAALTQTQETRQYSEGIIPRIGANALLAGVLGTLAPLIPKPEFDAAVTATRADLAQPVPSESTAGAAAVKETTLQQESIAPGGVFAAKIFGRISPLDRIMTGSVEPEARRVVQQLVDVPYLLNKNLEGVATGPSVEMVVQQQAHVRDLQIAKTMDAQYLEYKQVNAGSAMSRRDFSSAVADAANNGDSHEIPQVAAVAKATRAFFDADNKALAEAGIAMPEGGPVGARSYLPWVWDKHAVLNNQTALENVLTKWFTEHPKVEQVPVKEGVEPTTTLYHGSQYVFSDFDHSKIGTGEGNQSFGHGIYLSEKPEVAGSYAGELNGKPVETPQLYQARMRTADFQKMLDWDKPLSEQPQILKMLGIDPDAPVPLNGIDPKWTGGELHDALLKGKTNVGAPTGDKAGVADWLAKKGILGTRYLDNGSRAGVEAGGSRNTVLFKNAEATLTHRNGELINPEAMPATEPGKPQYREPAEVRAAVRDTIDHILGTVHGSADIGVGVKNPNVLNPRSLDLPWDLRKQFMSTDFEHITKAYNRTVLPQIEMRRAFGSTDMTDQLEKISDAYRIKIAQAGEDDALKAQLTKQQGKDIADLTLLRDRVMNQVGPRLDQSGMFVKASQLLRTFNYTRTLGGQTLSAPPDLGRLVTRYGLAPTAQRYAQYLTRMGRGVMLDDAQRMGTAADVVLHTRLDSLQGIGDELAGSDKITRFARNQSNFFTKVSGIATWDAMMRALSSQLEQDQIARIIGKENPTTWESALLAQHGIGADDLPAIKAQWDTHGSNEFGLNRARTDLWTDRGAASKVEQAVQRAASTTAFYVSKGDLPALANSEWGKMLIQFKAFSISSVNRLVIPLAQGLAHGDVHAANGAAALFALGGLSYYMKELAAGRKPDLSPDALVSNAVQRSGLLAYAPDVYDPIAGMMHLPRFAKFHDLSPADTLMGPSAGTLATMSRAIPGLLGGEPNAAQWHAVRQLIPYNNVFYWNRLFNMAEGKTADALGLRGAKGVPAQDYLNPAQDVAPRSQVDKAHLLGIQAIPNQF